MRDLAKLLGWVVLGVTATGCGGSTSVDPVGTLGPDGKKTQGERTPGGDECQTWEDWRYSVDESVSCEEARGYLSKCGEVCGETTSVTCSGADSNGLPIFIGGGEGAGKPCSAGGTKPVEIRCRKFLGRPPSGGCVSEGRRTDGLHAVDVDAFSSVGTYFANAAHLEAAAVLAFERLERELREQGAPPGLIGRMRRAARDERRHVEITSELARSFGAEPLPATAEPFASRSLFEIARENVIEGVVRETFGAAVALFRTERAATPKLRAALSEIAHDECRHAQLSWDMHAWMWSWLGAAERKAIEAARMAAIEELREAIAAEPAEEIVTVAGVPRASEAKELFDGLFANAWKRVA